MNYKNLIYVVIVVILLFCLVYWFKGHSAPQILGDAIFSINTSKKVVALTFDDGPTVPYTNNIIDILKKHNIKATFFILGQNAKNHIDVVRKIHEAGHDLGNHSWSHKRLVFKTPNFIKNEIEKTDNLIRLSGYSKTIHFRAPYGNKLIILPLILKSMNRPHILFDVIANDWENHEPKDIVELVEKQVHPGAIIVLHDGIVKEEAMNLTLQDRNSTAKALEILIPRLLEAGYQFVTISELLELRNK